MINLQGKETHLEVIGVRNVMIIEQTVNGVKMKLTFDQWMEELTEIAAKHDYEVSVNGFLTHELYYWRELFDQGMTPAKAWDKT